MTASRRIRLDLAYDGTEYAGWQVQPGARTIQETVEQALTRLQSGRPARIRGAGRTDAGVHARCQVADCLVTTPRADDQLHYRLRRMLPMDIRPLAVCTTSADFNAQHDALAKTYRYHLDLSRQGDPFRARYALHYPYPVDVDLIQRALALLPGRRDWSGFAGSACDVRDRVRTMTEAGFTENGAGAARFSFTADGFLNHMVRNLVGTLLDVGRGRLPVESMERALASGDRTEAGPAAPARGLCLERITYGVGGSCDSAG